MGSSAPEKQMFWLPLAVVIAAALATVLLAAWSDEDEMPQNEDHAAVGDSDVAASAQAAWSIKTRGVGKVARISEFDRNRISHQRGPLKTVVRDLYGALFLRPEERDKTIGLYFTHRSAKAFGRIKVGAPKTARQISTTRRKARVSIAIHGAQEAVTEVDIVARGTVHNRPVRIFHRSTLWMDRVQDKWRVVAFEVKQRQADVDRKATG